MAASTGEEEKNFRSTYYNKIGCKRADEKAVDKLLEEKPIDINKLIQYVNKFGLTPCRRIVVWKTLLGIKSLIGEDDEYISEIHQKVCNLLESALCSMSLIDDKTKNNTKLLLMYILEVKDLSSDVEKQLSSQDNKGFNAIATSFDNFGFPFVDTYWLMKAFFYKLEEQKQNIMKMAQKFTVDDKDLEKHLEETGAIDVLPISIWFYRCFSGIIHDSCLVKIWDRLIANSFKALPLIARYILLELKDSLMTKSSATEIRKTLLEPIQQTLSETIVAQVLESK